MQIDFTRSGITLRGFPGWPGWVFMVDIDWRTGKAIPGSFHEIRPPKDRHKPPSERPEVRRRIIEAAEAQCGGGKIGFGFVELVVASRPNPVGTHNRKERAKTIAMVYTTALEQGLIPRKVIARAYGLPINTRGNIEEYSNTVDRWIADARKFGYLPSEEEEKLRPRKWPNRGTHELEPSRGKPMLPEPERVGPHEGRTLTIYFDPITESKRNQEAKTVADFSVSGEWEDGKVEFSRILKGATLNEVVNRYANELNAEFNERFPGARVRSRLGSNTGEP